MQKTNLNMNIESLGSGAENALCSKDNLNTETSLSYSEMLSLSHLPMCIIDFKGDILSGNSSFELLRSATDYLLSGSIFCLRPRAGQIQLLEVLKAFRLKPLSLGQRRDIYMRATHGRAAFWMSFTQMSLQPHIAITIYAPDLTTVNPQRLEQRLQSLFELSQAEAQTASYLAQGMCAKDIALARGVSLPTIRTQLSAIRDKMGATTSLEAVAIIARVSLPF